jgi:hypothetical protein
VLVDESPPVIPAAVLDADTLPPAAAAPGRPPHDATTGQTERASAIATRCARAMLIALRA